MLDLTELLPIVTIPKIPEKYTFLHPHKGIHSNKQTNIEVFGVKQRGHPSLEVAHFGCAPCAQRLHTWTFSQEYVTKSGMLYTVTTNFWDAPPTFILDIFSLKANFAKVYMNQKDAALL